MSWQTSGNEHVKATLEKGLGSGTLPQSMVFVCSGQVVAEELAAELALRLTPKVASVLKVLGSEVQLQGLREVLSWLSFKNAGPDNQVLLVHNADELSLQAHNALLKTIEEPGSGNYIVLLAKRLNLPTTILSRCQVFHLEDTSEAGSQEVVQDLQTFTRKNAVDRLAGLLELAEDSTKFEARLQAWIESVTKLTSPKNAQNSGKILLEAWQRLKQNGNKKMVAEFLARDL